jgi:predicted phosphodiesterase
MQTYVVLNDIQMPYQDDQVLRLVIPFVQALKPHGVILNGDIVDAYPISDFDRNPADAHSLKDEAQLAGKLMERFKDVPVKWWIGGNHEDRVRRYLWKRAPDFEGVADLSFPQLFHLSDHGFKWLEYGDHLMLGKLLVTHGTMVRSVSGMSGRAHFDKYGTSVLIGHTHRLGVFYRRNVRGVHAAYENGCLCSLKPEYITHPDWQQGFAVVHVDEANGFFNVQQIPILERRCFFYGGERIGGAK